MPHPENLVPTEPGNKLAVKPRLLLGIFSQLALARSCVQSSSPRRHGSLRPSSAGTVDFTVRTLAVALMGLEWIEQTTAEKGYAKVPPRLIETTARMTTTAARLGTLLGLDPRSKAVIKASPPRPNRRWHRWTN